MEAPAAGYGDDPAIDNKPCIAPFIERYEKAAVEEERRRHEFNAAQAALDAARKASEIAEAKLVGEARELKLVRPGDAAHFIRGGVVYRVYLGSACGGNVERLVPEAVE